MSSAGLTSDGLQGPPNPRRVAVLRAANTVFLRNGYVGASVDEIAAIAAVSKQTVYKHFIDKEHLFTELVNSTVKEISDSMHYEALNLGESNSVEDDLCLLARRTLTGVMQPAVLQLRRLVIGEATRFPELGRTFYELGPGRFIESLAVAFVQLAERGILQLDNAMLAAEHFNWLVMAIPLNRAMFFGDAGTPGQSELDQYARAGVKVFLVAYGLQAESVEGPPPMRP
jgi:TetR/AcrR family transcriptional repressor of mexJK operon